MSKEQTSFDIARHFVCAWNALQLGCERSAADLAFARRRKNGFSTNGEPLLDSDPFVLRLCFGGASGRAVPV